MDPSTLSIDRSPTTSSSYPTLTPSVGDSFIVVPSIPPDQEQEQHQPSPPSSPPALAAETATVTAEAEAEAEAEAVDMGNILHELPATTLTPTAIIAAAAAAITDTLPTAPTITPPPPAVDEDAQRAFQEEYGDRFTQTTYWSCQSEGVFKGHCGWHEPIIEVAAAAGAGSGAAPLAAGSGGVVVVAVGVAAVVGGLVFVG